MGSESEVFLDFEGPSMAIHVLIERALYGWAGFDGTLQGFKKGSTEFYKDSIMSLRNVI